MAARARPSARATTGRSRTRPTARARPRSPMPRRCAARRACPPAQSRHAPCALPRPPVTTTPERPREQGARRACRRRAAAAGLPARPPGALSARSFGRPRRRQTRERTRSAGLPTLPAVRCQAHTALPCSCKTTCSRARAPHGPLRPDGRAALRQAPHAEEREGRPPRAPAARRSDSWAMDEAAAAAREGAEADAQRRASEPACSPEHARDLHVLVGDAWARARPQPYTSASAWVTPGPAQGRRSAAPAHLGGLHTACGSALQGCQRCRSFYTVTRGPAAAAGGGGRCRLWRRGVPDAGMHESAGRALMLVVDAMHRRGRAAARGLRRGVPLAADVHRRDALLPRAGGAPDLACTSPGCALDAPAALRICHRRRPRRVDRAGEARPGRCGVAGRVQRPGPILTPNRARKSNLTLNGTCCGAGGDVARRVHVRHRPVVAGLHLRRAAHARGAAPGAGTAPALARPDRVFSCAPGVWQPAPLGSARLRVCGGPPCLRHARRCAAPNTCCTQVLAADAAAGRAGARGQRHDAAPAGRAPIRHPRPAQDAQRGVRRPARARTRSPAPVPAVAQAGSCVGRHRRPPDP